MATIELTNISKSFPAQSGTGQLNVLDDFSLTVNDGEFLCLLGPSGCGKSTSLDILAGLTHPDLGSVTVGGRSDWAGLSCGYVFQRPQLLNWRTVRQNLEFALAGKGVARAEWKEYTDRYLELVGLTDFAESYPLSLSGGMQQRVALARGLVIEPDVLLMDEPFSSLDELTARRLRVELLEIVADQLTTVLFVTHNALEAAFLADRICVVSPRPARIVEQFEVPVGRPRRPEDVALVEVQQRVLGLLDADAQLADEPIPQST
ncbi:ABC transporter ATP-binding protein [Aeromicrobium sp. CTD01-1L150]|uniref:ABC transporter ATP-binding protein n=1 Tax=Aeromicrobium sp. CTD01-1L150 TaxID=3341830 RepID=UPI0035C1F4B9